MQLQHETFVTPVELKFLGDETQPGYFEGLGAVFNNVDSYGDMIIPGAFDEALAEYRTAGTMPGLYAEHSPYFGGDPLPVGIWTEVAPDNTGLRVKGKLSALDTDQGRRIRGLMLDGALKGLSIAFKVRPGGAVYTNSKKPGEAKRLLKSLSLASIDIVRDPSNPRALVDSVKAVLAVADHQAACKSVAACIALHRSTMSASDSPTADERAQMLQHLKDAHKALTGADMPAGMKSITTLREIEIYLRDGGFSNTEARAIAERGFKSLLPREEGQDEASDRAALTDLRSAVAAFSLPKFEDA